MNLKSFFTTFFLFFFLTSYSQTIKGIILEKIHKLPIENIEINYNKKSFFTDVNGEFEFKIVNYFPSDILIPQNSLGVAISIFEELYSPFNILSY